MTKPRVSRKLADLTERMVGFRRIYTAHNKLANTSKRKLDETAAEAGAMLKERDLDLPEGSGLIIRLRHEDTAKARGMKDGIREFKQEHPKYGGVLQGMIDKSRAVRRDHLTFDYEYELSEEDCVKLLMEMGLSEERAIAVYSVSEDLGDDLEGFREGPYDILLP